MKVAARIMLDACVFNNWGNATQTLERQGYSYRVARTDVVAAPREASQTRVAPLDANGRIPQGTLREGQTYSVTGHTTMTETQEPTIHTYVRRHPLAMSALHPEIVR
jgi:hypothetical protein